MLKGCPFSFVSASMVTFAGPLTPAVLRVVGAATGEEEDAQRGAGQEGVGEGRIEEEEGEEDFLVPRTGPREEGEKKEGEEMKEKEEGEPEEEPGLRRSGRPRQPPNRYSP